MSYKNNHAYKFFNREEPEEVKRLCDALPLEITHGELADLFELLLDGSVEEGKSSTTIGDGLLDISIINHIDFEGSAEYRSYESSTDIEIHDKEGNELCEVHYAIGTAHCSDSNLMHFEVILPEKEEDKDVAKLSELPSVMEVDIESFKLYDTRPAREDLQTLRNIGKGEWKMTNTLRTVNVTLIDNNSNLKGEAKVVFQKKDIVTEYSDEDTKMNIIAEGEVAKALSKHNEGVRAKTVDRDILRSTGRDVALDPIELLSDSRLSWSFVQVA